MVDYFKELFKEPSNTLSLIGIFMTVALGIYVLRSNKKDTDTREEEQALQSFVNELGFLHYQSINIGIKVIGFLGFKEGFNAGVRSVKIDALNEDSREGNRLSYNNIYNKTIFNTFGDITEEEMRSIFFDITKEEIKILSEDISKLKKVHESESHIVEHSPVEQRRVETNEEIRIFMKNIEKVDWQKFPPQFAYLYYDTLDILDILNNNLKYSWEKEESDEVLNDNLVELQKYLDDINEIKIEKQNEIEK